jgi:hypothetical protein
MIHTRSLYEACQELFIDYPLAVRAEDPAATIHSMVLMIRDRDDPQFFVLMRDSAHGKFSYSLWPWLDGPAEVIEAGGSTTVSEAAEVALSNGLPIPTDGSLFGWVSGDSYTALLVIYADYTSCELPTWSVMPLVEGGSEVQWPPFTDERLLGDWFWEQHGIGMIVPLESLITEHPGTVFWVDSRSSIGSDCCAVACDISGSQGATLCRGRYVYHRVLRQGYLVPPLAVLLADPGKTDLAERFQRSGNGDPLAARCGS